MTACKVSPAVDRLAEVAPAPPPLIALARPADGSQITFGPFNVPAGKNVQLCRTLQLDNDHEVAVNRFELKMLANSHHFILFRAQPKPDGTYYQYPDQVFDCQQTLNFEEWAFVFDINRAGGDDIHLGEGQAVVFEPHARLLVQAHFLNEAKEDVKGYDVLNLYNTDRSKVAHEIHGKFTVDTRIDIPPKSIYSTSRRCSFSRTVHITAMTGHFHKQGTKFEVMYRNMIDDSDISQAYCSGESCSDPDGAASNWGHPLFKYFDPPLLVNGTIDAQGQGLYFTCSYDNETGNEIRFGGLADTQEHCNLFFQYYFDRETPLDGTPAGQLQCAEGSGGW